MKQKSDYWKIRDGILKAIEADDEEALRDFAANHAEIFKQMVSQAKNSKYKIVKMAYRK